jgi:sulfate adenylyltransferase subunit 1
LSATDLGTATGEVELLRLTTAGSVDDGKSTLIGRLLVDTKGAFEDQISAARDYSVQRGGDGIDLALLTDGLRAEREQGITIDVAYRYFATPRRRFIIADTPGHEQYTRNMVTGASTAELALILVDARNGVVAQSRRHVAIARLLGISDFVIAINKMDLVDYDPGVFARVRAEFGEFMDRFDGYGFRPAAPVFVPMSAALGDMVVERGERMAWYRGPTLLEVLESARPSAERATTGFRFAVQMVSRPQGAAEPDFRGYMGRIASGSVAPGDRVRVLPSGHETEVTRIVTFDGDLERAAAPRSVTLVLGDDLDVSRGDMLVSGEDPPRVVTGGRAVVCWMADTPLDPKTKYFLRHTSRTTRCLITSVEDRIDIDTLGAAPAGETLGKNDIGRIAFRTLQPLAVDAYRDNRETGAFILIDPSTHNTVACGMIEPASGSE